MLRIPKYNKTESGFTIIEMAILVMVGGMILAFLGSALIFFMENNRKKTTVLRQGQIEEAVLWYLNANGHYPCPASLTAGPNTTGNPGFARSITVDCDAGAFAGTTRSNNVRIGAVPTRTLNLPDNFIVDGWGNKFTYAVTESMATPTKYRVGNGGIRMRDRLGNITATDIEYTLLSHGNTGKGGYSMDGNRALACPAPAPVPANADDENCDSDSTFASMMINTDATNDAEFFDDYISYSQQSINVSGMPAGAIIPLTPEHPACPPGWRHYTKAEGRMPIGAQDTPLVKDQTLLVARGDSVTLPLRPGMRYRGQAGVTSPQYIVLLFCEKMPEPVIKSNIKTN